MQDLTNIEQINDYIDTEKNNIDELMEVVHKVDENNELGNHTYITKEYDTFIKKYNELSDREKLHFKEVYDMYALPENEEKNRQLLMEKLNILIKKMDEGKIIRGSVEYGVFIMTYEKCGDILKEQFKSIYLEVVILGYKQKIQQIYDTNDNVSSINGYVGKIKELVPDFDIETEFSGDIVSKILDGGKK